jgi:hypothetical protein
LNCTFRPQRFDLVVFQFPNAGSRKSIDGRTANYDLLLNFLASARKVLKEDGHVAITIIDSSYYRGSFDVFGAAREADFSVQGIYKFKGSDYQGYQHENTQDEASALDRRLRCLTWVLGLS